MCNFNAVLYDITFWTIQYMKTISPVFYEAIIVSEPLELKDAYELYVAVKNVVDLDADFFTHIIT
ncbi:hypothetical protein RASY3_14250 [Ruminococcus albus SY3]|uniref:Uncharacterized protein n=1 Tax=Ruminococcus albus SY3 TaxID=1341156 RepID=A0A011WNF6_RUMAL|nr:hypothetical protein RASY3_14250 [Ruminococcus albus SY3]